MPRRTAMEAECSKYRARRCRGRMPGATSAPSATASPRGDPTTCTSSAGGGCERAPVGGCLPADYGALSRMVRMTDPHSDLLTRLQRLLDDGRKSEARSLARATLDELPASAEPLLVGALQLVELRAALDMGPATQELARLCRDALNNVRGDEDLESRARLSQLRLALDLQDDAAARDAHVWLGEHRPRLAPNVLGQLFMLESQLAPSREAGCEHLLRGIASLPAGHDQLELRLVLAHVQLGVGQATESLDALLLEALENAEHHQIIYALESLAWYHYERLSAETIQRVVDSAQDRAPHVSGFLLARTGRVEEGIQTLRGGIQRESEHLRARSLHILLPLLPNGPERRRHVDELEQLLDRDDHPEARHDLAWAQAQLASAERDVELMERALANARRAAPSLARVGTETVVDVLAELIVLRSGEPTAELGKLGTELLRTVIESGILGTAEAELRAASAMTMYGPLCHTEVLESAAALAALSAPSDAHEKAREMIVARCVWLLGRQRGDTADPGDWPSGPFDDAPQWLIDLCLGIERPVTPDELQVERGLLLRVIDARPDVADHLLATMVRSWETATGDWVGELEDSIVNGVERPINFGPNAWPKLHAAVEQLRTRSKRAWLDGLAATLSRARGETPPAATAPAQAASTSEYLQMLFARARATSERVRQMGTRDCEPETELARAQYCEALAAAEHAGDVVMLFHIRVGYGNALRWGSKPDLEAALRQYRAAESLGVDDQQALAKLWKVWGDGLCERGGDDDLREAYQLISKSIENRTGRLRAESLLSAELVAARHPDFDTETRLRRSIQHMLDATRAGPEIADEIIPDLCLHIAELIRQAPRDHGMGGVLDELQRRHPQHVGYIHQARRGVGQSVDPELLESVPYMMMDPDCSVAMRAAGMIADPATTWAEMPEQVRGSSSIENLRAMSLRDDPERLRAEIARLSEDQTTEGATGRQVAQVVLIAQLVRLGRRDESEARRATATARRALRDHPAPRTREVLGTLLSMTWQAHESSDKVPMCDFDLSRELAAEAVEVVGGVERASSDVVVLLARGHRYARTGDRNEHLRRARALYAGLHARALAAGDGDTAAISLNHQVDAELEMAVGDRRVRLREGIATLERARSLARSARRIAEIDVSIAWYMTQLSDRVDEAERRTLLEQALARFDSVDRSAAPSVANLEHLRSVCLGSLEQCRNGEQAAVEFYEKQVADPQLSDYDRAIAQHNLAIHVRRVPRVDSTHVLRALVLFDAAAKVREPVSARHAWETCYEAGLMLVHALRSEQGLAPELLPWERPVAVMQARSWLERALRAAMQLGPGEELVDVAVMLGRLVFDLGDFDAAAELAERSWDALRHAAPYLMFRDELRGWEANFCRNVALRLAGLALDSGIVGTGSRVRAINTEASKLVIHWLLRAQASARRPTLARIQRPETATVPWWSSWQAALDQRDPREIARLLEQLHGQEPHYLTGEPTLDETWTWLQTETEAVAIAVVLDGGHAICGVLDLDGRGTRRARVLVMPSNAPPGDEAQLIAHVKDAVLGDPTALGVHELIVKWVRESIVLPMLDYLGRPPKTVLWCPGPVLRLATPASVWAGVPIACVHSLALPRYARPKERPRSTLVVAAMKRGEHMAKSLEANAASMLNHAKRNGSARALVSAAASFGAGLQSLKPIRNTPASPEDVLAEAPNHDIVVVLAHGGAGTQEMAALECVDAEGRGVLLTGRDLAAHHDAFANATVVLLACSAGRIGGELHTPDGVAGALLAAGARAVIAPLWTVTVNVAIYTAQKLLDGFAKGLRPWQVLANLPAHVFEPGPTLDGPSPADKRAGRVVQLQSFVVWLG